VKGISEAKADKILAYASQIIPMGFCSANDYHQQRQDMFFSHNWRDRVGQNAWCRP
jgi:hypothetical protein